MAGFTASEWIARPPDEVFAYAVDAANAPKWLRDVEKVEPITEGPLRVGTRLRGTRILGGVAETAELEVTEFEANRLYAATTVMYDIEATYRYTFTPERGGTRVDLEGLFRAKSLAARLTVAMIAHQMDLHDGGQLRDLKAAIESEG